MKTNTFTSKSHTTMTTEMQQMVSLLEPYLKSGLSIRKASIEAKINRASLYRYARANKEFWEQITSYRNYASIVATNALVTELINLCMKQQGNSKNNIKPRMLEASEVRLLKWFVNSTHYSKDEFNRQKKLLDYDPNYELSKVSKL